MLQSFINRAIIIDYPPAVMIARNNEMWLEWFCNKPHFLTNCLWFAPSDPVARLFRQLIIRINVLIGSFKSASWQTNPSVDRSKRRFVRNDYADQNVTTANVKYFMCQISSRKYLTNASQLAIQVKKLECKPAGQSRCRQVTKKVNFDLSLSTLSFSWTILKGLCCKYWSSTNGQPSGRENSRKGRMQDGVGERVLGQVCHRVRRETVHQPNWLLRSAPGPPSWKQPTGSWFGKYLDIGQMVFKGDCW